MKDKYTKPYHLAYVKNKFKLMGSRYYIPLRLLKSVIKQITKVSRSVYVLDSGGGEGALIYALLKVLRPHILADLYIVNLDINLNALKFAKQIMRSLRYECCTFDLIHADVQYPPFRKDAFDIITSLEVIEHVDDDKAYLKSLIQTTKKYVILTTPRFLGYIRSEEHKREYSYKSLLSVLENLRKNIEFDYHLYTYQPAIHFIYSRRQLFSSKIFRKIIGLLFLIRNITIGRLIFEQPKGERFLLLILKSRQNKSKGDKV